MSRPPVVEPPRRLILLRHGQTAWNLERRIQGHSDAELDELGHAQAREAAKELAALQPRLLWSSDLARAQVTAEYVAEACDLRAHCDARLREYALGPREGLLHEEYAAAHPAEFAIFRSGHFGIVPGGESTAAVATRMVAALTELLVATPPGSLAVAVSHGAALKVAIATLLGWEPSQAHSLGVLGNAHWAVLSESPVTGALKLAAYNRSAPGPP